ncbi:efflux RND transporter periplasmic adaptor subunit [Cochlodiniinecator piscidefendens]|uniref:efflux RND transporter periplasmic adaptor subunit n=1 Tax=Cochlodiniinecator piscidefendens TaxID=2715756 RepID=UPI00140C64C0|nr:efflux RND transporter periplasmic adaptor subunit [Cochlodiniinecator piscidefendens]
MKRLGFIAGLFSALVFSAAVAQDAPRSVKLATIELDNVGFERRFFGRVVARQTVDLAFQVGGQIIEFPVVEGTELPQGALIAQLDLAPFERQLAQAELQSDQAGRVLTRLNSLSASSVSQVSIQDAETNVASAEISVEVARDALNHATLHMPFDGLIASRNTANFTTINAGTAVVRLHDMSELRVEIDVPEILFRGAQEDDQSFEIYAVFPGSDERFPLQLREYVAEAASVGQTFRITLGMARPEGMQLLPGASVTVVAQPRVNNNAVVILPASALSFGPNGETFLFVFNSENGEAGSLERVEVEIDASEDGRIVLLDGPAVGTEIVATGTNVLIDGQDARRFVGFGQ